MNLIDTLEKNKCLESPRSTGGNKKKDNPWKNIKLDYIVVTHPDQDHYGGINALLKNGFEDIKKNDKCRYTVCCPIISTTVTQLSVVKKSPKNKRKNKKKNKRKNKKKSKGKKLSGNEYSSKIRRPLQFWFQEGSPGKKHKIVDYVKQDTTVCIGKSQTHKKFDSNATSILTTVQLPVSSELDYDVVLTGDSNSNLITNSLNLSGKHVGIFQVPHHGSNCNYPKSKPPATIKKVEIFYSSFEADIYLISHGCHGSYNHPHSEVITGIINAAVEKKRQCKIVVTATWFDDSKIIRGTNDPKWSEYVRIYHFKDDISYVTLNPSIDTMPCNLHEVSFRTQPMVCIQSQVLSEDVQII